MRWSLLKAACCSLVCLFAQASASTRSDYVQFYNEYLTEEKIILEDAHVKSPTPTPPSPPSPPSPPGPPSPPPPPGPPSPPPPPGPPSPPPPPGPPSPPPPPPGPPSPPPSPTPPAPLLNYAPILIVNNTGIDPSRIYFLGTGKDIADTTAHFLQPDLSTGVCSYALPTTNNSADSDISVTLSQLPTSGTNCYLIYLPQQISGRCYLSIDAPLYLQTTSTTIAQPVENDPRDPNFYTLYQDFELTLDAGYNLFANISNVDYYSLPMGLSSFSYPSGNAYPTLDGLTASGFAETVGRQSVLTTVSQGLTSQDDSSPKQWYKLVVPYYSNPYTQTTPTTTLRILSAKNSITYAVNNFVGAAVPQKAFNSNYLQSTTSGPVSGQSYMQALWNFYNSGSTLTFSVFPQSEAEATYLMQKGTSANTLYLQALSGAGATDIVLQLNNLTTLDLLGGDAGAWNNSGVFVPSGVTVWNTEIAKLCSALFSIGQWPNNKSPTSDNLPQPVISAESYFTNYRNTYFTDPVFNSSSTQHGPWFNLFDSLMHPLMVQTGGYGLGYAYDFDDVIGLGGEMHVLIQTSGVLNSAYPYYEVIAGPIDTSIPDPTSAYGPYSLTINPIASGSTSINIIYSTSATSAPSVVQAVPVAPQSPVELKTVYNYFEVQYVPQGKTYKVYPKHQLVLPTTTSYDTEDATLMSGIAFTEVEDSGEEFTISLPNLSP